MCSLWLIHLQYYTKMVSTTCTVYEISVMIPIEVCTKNGCTYSGVEMISQQRFSPGTVLYHKPTTPYGVHVSRSENCGRPTRASHPYAAISSCPGTSATFEPSVTQVYLWRAFVTASPNAAYATSRPFYWKWYIGLLARLHWLVLLLETQNLI